MVAVVGVTIMAILYVFNGRHYVNDEYLVTNIAALLWLPMLMIFLVFRQEPETFGFSAGDTKQGYKIAGLFYILILPALIFLSRKPEYQGYYPMNRDALLSTAAFCRFEMVYGVYLFCWEFFFRGFLLFGLSRALGLWPSVFVQAIPFGIMHMGKPEFGWSFAGGAILGYMAMKSKSFMPCFVLHWAVSVTFDILVVMAGRGHLF